ncbi:beta-carotene 15,15'-monooxygenase [Soonwooa sp.]|uniref:beta-carotene 15,15'-monooxygenase n=1 Tax=Soonwooa sp. TaxID=1938592 RepID=UPI0028997038|nr:beta-carotene 15,15'-monooxygenase [Soonwooa sp.]
MPNNDFNIDDLKSVWQNQKVEEAYQQSDIEAMLNTKSRNYVKYLLWISLLEFFIFITLLIYSLVSKDDHVNFREILSRLHLQNQNEILHTMDKIYLVIKILSLSLTGIFVYLFYKSYRRISVEDNLKQFILRIISFKRKVNAFIIINVILLVVYIVSFSIYLSIVMGEQSVQLSETTKLGFIIGIIVALLLSILLIILYYKIFYGILLKRLSKNLEQLRLIETEKENQ